MGLVFRKLGIFFVKLAPTIRAPQTSGPAPAVLDHSTPSSTQPSVLPASWTPSYKIKSICTDYLCSKWSYFPTDNLLNELYRAKLGLTVRGSSQYHYSWPNPGSLGITGPVASFKCRVQYSRCWTRSLRCSDGGWAATPNLTKNGQVYKKLSHGTWAQLVTKWRQDKKNSSDVQQANNLRVEVISNYHIQNSQEILDTSINTDIAMAHGGS